MYTGWLPASALPFPAGPLDDRAQLSAPQDWDSSPPAQRVAMGLEAGIHQGLALWSRPLGRTLWGQTWACSPWSQFEGANSWQHQRAMSLVWMGHRETILPIREKSASGSTAVKWKETI